MTTKGHVYVIDDDAAMRDSLNFLLDSCGFGVTLFDDAQSFLDALPGLAFGCVVSDVRMPGIDGIELLKRMKAIKSRFPILIMTGHGDVPLAVEAMKLGAVDFLEKPFEDIFGDTLGRFLRVNDGAALGFVFRDGQIKWRQSGVTRADQLKYVLDGILQQS